MEWFQIVFLALIQGITEFLPISSSAHLLLPKEILGWPDQGLAFDVSVHIGSLCAVLVYLRRDVQQLSVAWAESLSGQSSDESRLAWYIIVATVPAGITGLMFNDIIEQHLRSLMTIMMTTLVFGLLLGWADKANTLKSEAKSLANITLTMAIFIGIAQAVALIPGTSRSGITITIGLLFGLQRQEAGKFSFLLSIPIIILSGGYKVHELMGSDGVIWSELFWGAVISGISAYLCIYFFLSMINRIGMMPFVIYRVALAGILGMMIYFS